MSFSLVHVSDPHFGEVADLRKIAAFQALVPDLEPTITVVSGDLTLRSRHGEFLAAKLFVQELERTAPVFLIPGNHDVQWWWRPFIPMDPATKYAKYRRHFGPTLAPTLQCAEAVITSAVTAHGVAWGSLTPRLRDIAIKGHLRNRDIRRAKDVFEKASPEQLRVLVLHHNVLRGEVSQRMGLARWRQAQKRIVDSGADVVLCGHDHQDQVDLLNGVVVSCAGTVSTRTKSAIPSAFHRIALGEESVEVDIYRWEPEKGVFRRSEVCVFPRKRLVHEAELPAGAV